MIVEDDPQVRKQLTSLLARENIQTIATASLSEVSRTDITRTDILLLDRNLPDGEGLDLLKSILAYRSMPTLVLSALGESRHRVEGLDAGAEDYLVKPFDEAELCARVRVLLRRVQKQERPRISHFGPLELDRSGRVAHVNNVHIKLNPKGFDLLVYFCDNYQSIVTRSMLLQHVWNLSFDPQTNLVDVSINRLRTQFQKAGCPNPIINVRGKGFKLSFEETQG